MKIVHVITRLIIGGAQENTILTCEGLAERGHDVILMAGPTTGPEGSLVERARAGGREGAERRYTYEEYADLVRQISPLQDLRAVSVLKRRFRELKPDVVHTHSSKAGVIGRVAAHQAGVPIVVHTIHGMAFNRTQSGIIQSAFRFAERFCARSSHAIVCVADAMREQSLAAGVGRPEQFLTVRSGMETEQFDPTLHDAAEVRAEWGIRPDEIVVGTIARLFVNKGYEQLIEVIELAARRDPRLKFVWVGDGADRGRYEAELERRGLRDRVVLTGLLPPSLMPRVLSGFDMLAHTSQWEGLPRAVVQALLMEKPAISFEIDGAPEIVRPGETGELAPLGDVEAFAEAVLRLAGDESGRLARGRLGRERCLHAFDWRTMVEHLDALYTRLVSRSGHLQPQGGVIM